MRIAQVIVFMFGVFCFLSAAFFTGQETGDTLWRIGVAAMLIDLAWTKLWPSAKTS